LDLASRGPRGHDVAVHTLDLALLPRRDRAAPLERLVPARLRRRPGGGGPDPRRVHRQRGGQDGRPHPRSLRRHGHSSPSGLGFGSFSFIFTFSFSFVFSRAVPVAPRCSRRIAPWNDCSSSSAAPDPSVNRMRRLWRELTTLTGKDES